MNKRALMEPCEARRLLAFDGRIPALFGSVEFEIVQAVLPLTDGRTVVAGIYGQGTAFTPGQLAPKPRGDSDGFVAMLSRTGQLEWVRTFGGGTGKIRERADRLTFPGNPLRAGDPAPLGVCTEPLNVGESVTGLALAQDDTILVTGIFKGVASFGPTNLDADRVIAGDGDYYDSFVARYSTRGDLRQVRQIGGPFNDIVTSIKTDSGGHVYLAGSFERRANFALSGPPQVKEPDGRQDIFAVKYDPTLTRTIWFAGMGSDADRRPEIEVARDMVVDGSGNVYLAGVFSQKADFDPDPQRRFILETKGRRTGAFTMRLSHTGNLVWAKAQVGERFVGNTALTLGGEESVYTVGYFNETAGLDANQPSRLFSAIAANNRGGARETDLFITKWSRNNGSTQWVKQIGGSEYEYAAGIALTSKKQLAVWGTVSGKVDFDPNRGRKLLTTPEGDFGNDNNHSGRDFAYAGFVATYRPGGSLANARLINPRGNDKDLFIQTAALRPDARSFVIGGRAQGGINITRVGSTGPAFNRDLPKNDYRDDGFVFILDQTLNLPVA